jgi:hypothetical protein
MFADKLDYERVKSTGIINARLISRLYGLAESDVTFFQCDAALAFKASMKRAIVCGDVGDSDIYGAQQHAPLLDIEIPLNIEPASRVGR